jgi:hypothetical protein
MERFVTVGMLSFGENLLLEFGRVDAGFLNTPPQDRTPISEANLGSEKHGTLPR